MPLPKCKIQNLKNKIPASEVGTTFAELVDIDRVKNIMLLRHKIGTSENKNFLPKHFAGK